MSSLGTVCRNPRLASRKHQTSPSGLLRNPFDHGGPKSPILWRQPLGPPPAIRIAATHGIHATVGSPPPMGSPGRQPMGPPPLKRSPQPVGSLHGVATTHIAGAHGIAGFHGVAATLKVAATHGIGWFGVAPASIWGQSGIQRRPGVDLVPNSRACNLNTLLGGSFAGAKLRHAPDQHPLKLRTALCSAFPVLPHDARSSNFECQDLDHVQSDFPNPRAEQRKDCFASSLRVASTSFEVTRRRNTLATQFGSSACQSVRSRPNSCPGISVSAEASTCFCNGLSNGASRGTGALC